MLSKILSFYRSILVSVFMANVARKTGLFWRAKWCFYPPLRSALCPENVPLQNDTFLASRPCFSLVASQLGRGEINTLDPT